LIPTYTHLILKTSILTSSTWSCFLTVFAHMLFRATVFI